MKKIEEEHHYSNKKSVIFLGIFRPFDVRLMLNTGIVDNLSIQFKVVLLAPIELLPTLRRFCNDSVEVEILQYSSSKYDSGHKTTGVIKKNLESLFRQIFSLTYGRKEKYENLTRTLHVATYRKGSNTFVSRIVRELILIISWITCRIKIIRKIILSFSSSNLFNNLHEDIFNKWQPSAIIVCSVGLELDARLIVEFRKYKVPSITVVQSWDKTSSKGYPLAMPDRVLVWSEVMAKECRNFLDISEDKIEVVGAPIFDTYFNSNIRKPKQLFIQSLGLDSSQKNIFCALNTPAYHQGNLDLAILLSTALEEEKFSQSANLILRVHPAYYENSDKTIINKRTELLSLLNNINSNPFIHVNFPDISEEIHSYVINPDDLIFMTNMLAYSDVSISVLSTQMVEAALLDCPAITIEYGHWSSNVLRTELENFRLEHLERVLKTNAVSRARNSFELLSLVNDCLQNPKKFRNERKNLANQEVPINRGISTIKVIESIEKFLRVSDIK